MSDTLIAGSDTNDAAQQAADGVKPEGSDAAKAPTTESQPAAGDKPAEEGKAPEGDAAKSEEIVYDFKAPEGMELDKDDLAGFTQIAKELKLPADKAQAIVDLAIKREEARAAAHVEQVKQWAASVKADKEIGGDKLTESQAIASKAINLGPPELKDFLNDTGLGNHPLFFKWAHAVGKALSEDRFVAGTTAPAGPKSLEERLYGSTAKA